MEYFVSFVALAAFGYFIYSRVQKSKQERESRPTPTPRPREPYDPDRDLR